MSVGVERVGETSVTWRFALTSPTGRALATVRHVHVCVDRASFRPRALPAELLPLLR